MFGMWISGAIVVWCLVGGVRFITLEKDNLSEIELFNPLYSFEVLLWVGQFIIALVCGPFYKSK